MKEAQLNENNKKVFTFLKEHFPGDWQPWKLSTIEQAPVIGFKLKFSHFYLSLYVNESINILIPTVYTGLNPTFGWTVHDLKTNERVRTFNSHSSFKSDRIFLELEGLIKELPLEYKNELKIELFELALLNEQIKDLQTKYDSHRKTLDYYEQSLSKATERRLTLEQAKWTD